MVFPFKVPLLLGWRRVFGNPGKKPDGVVVVVLVCPDVPPDDDCAELELVPGPEFDTKGIRRALSLMLFAAAPPGETGFASGEETKFAVAGASVRATRSLAIRMADVGKELSSPLSGAPTRLGIVTPIPPTDRPRRAG
jgi:hypothetical protein